jgi:tRNA-uridine 2-sulfurtransferase
MTRSAPDDWLPDAVRRGREPHVVIALSGGVDSSLAAALVKRAGLRCSAVFMKNWEEPTADGHCQWEDDVADALAVCDRLDIPLNTVNLSADYRARVFDDFLEGYRRGRTPNPDVLCNREIKFKAFLEHAQALGGTHIATGHYVRRGEDGTALTLEKGADANKDQSYFLYTLGQYELAQALFPIGGMAKAAVRAAAREAGLPTHEKKDSTGICFIGERPFREFLAGYLAAAPGDVVTADGRRIGVHHGAVYYTLGQRQGLGIGGVRGAAEAPWFVAAKDLARNELIVVQGHDHPALSSRRLWASELSWIAGTAPVLPLRCSAKTRYRQPDQACVIESITDGVAAVAFESPQRAVTPGQSVVFYLAAHCLGGGIIDRTA